jgi:hypothetical protein
MRWYAEKTPKESNLRAQRLTSLLCLALAAAARGGSSPHLLKLRTGAFDPLLVIRTHGQTAARVLRARQDALGGRPLARVTPDAIPDIARPDDVRWIEEVGELTLRNNTTRWVMQSDAPDSVPLWDHGLHGEGQIVGHIDSPIDLTHFMFAASVPPGPSHSKIVGWRALLGLEDTMTRSTMP